jgi:predicted molibdopterin-dependent oxidoreductase YjgC
MHRKQRSPELVAHTEPGRSCGLSGVVSGDTITLSFASTSGSFPDKAVGANKVVTISGLISREDTERVGIKDGDVIRLISSVGSYEGRAKIDQIKPGNLEVHWPEGSCLLSREEIDLASREPDYNAIVKLEKAGRAGV